MNDIDKFVEYIIDSNTSFQEVDRIYLVNRIKALIGDKSDSDSETVDILKLRDGLVQTAVDNQKIPDTTKARSIMGDQLMDLATPIPSTVNEIFWNLYQRKPEHATNYFYQLCQKNDYIRKRENAQNISFTADTKYGPLEITIDPNRPDDAKSITKENPDDYPKCLLCMENEGYSGNASYPSRANLRIIRFKLGDQSFGFQFSPYSYFKEHAIFLSAEHKPMVINRQTFINLLSIVEDFPDYFVGSNADLPIVGGTILHHEHYQGGRHTFPLMNAKIRKSIDLKSDDVTAGIVDWPMSTIRLASTKPQNLIPVADEILNKWDQFSDESVNIRAYTNKTKHHSITPIAYLKNDKYILDLILRDNQTSAKYPDGIFHSHPDVQHIKPGNIGLIEALGLAILPGRLKAEFSEVKKYLLDQPNNIAVSHRPWADEIKTDYAFTPENVDELLEQEIANSFAKMLEDAGVFKNNELGNKAFDKFITQLKED